MSLCASVCNNTVVMWSLFTEVIVSFCIKKHRENLCNTGKTQGISFWLQCGHPVIETETETDKWQQCPMANPDVVLSFNISVLSLL